MSRGRLVTRAVTAAAEVAAARPVVIQGLAEVSGAPLGGATLQAFDVATGAALGQAGPALPQTGADGLFGFRLPADATPRLVKLVVSGAGQTLTTVIDARTARAVGALPAGPGGAVVANNGGALVSDQGGGIVSNNGGAIVAGGSYRLAQEASEVTLWVHLNGAGTVASQAFEGPFKVQLRARGPRGVLDPVFDAANRAARAVQNALDTTPALAARIAAAVGPDGRVRDTAGFKQVLTELRVVEAVTDSVHETLRAVAGQPQAPDAAPVPLRPEDFPLGDVTVTGEAYSFETRDGEVVSGTVAAVEPQAQPSASAVAAPASPTPTPAPAGGSGGGSGGGRAPAPPSLTLSLPTRYDLVRAVGDATGGNAAGSSATTAALGAVAGVAVAPDGTIFLADPRNHQVRRSVAGGPAERIAGAAAPTPGFLDNVTATAGLLHTPAGLLWDAAKGVLLVCDAGNRRVRFLTPGGTIGTLAGGGGTTTSPTTVASLQLDEPVALAASPTGATYVADRSGGRVWRLDSDRTATLVATAPGACALALDFSRDLLWVGTTDGKVLRVTSAANTPVPDVATPVFTRDAEPVLGLATDQQRLLFVLAATAGGDARLWRVATDAQGRLEAGQASTPVAGTGVAGAGGAAYAAPTAAIPDARTARIAIRHPGSLYLDLSAANSVGPPSGQLYVGSSFDDGVAHWGQVLKLELTL
jgi:sugar lactone lactonase YvrE